ncbi:MAG TPA: DUF2868 domain-containing protein [Casimicrobiaceae bacterium]|nr:DUF2868 domain-containing protein [Casimicrobiaceae bacterium]
MDERTAIAVTAVRAVETTDRARTVLTDADRAWASRAAAEVVGASATPASFIGRRALLALERLAERRHRVARLASAWRWRPWVGGAVIAAAFVVGVAANEIGGAKRVNILYSPVAPLVLWNVVVYALLAARFVVRYGEAAGPGPIERTLARLAGGLRSAGRRDDEAVVTFTRAWTATAASTYAVRAARILHFAAAALALGVIAGLYLRGLGLEYRATWESTFLDASTVRSLVAVFYAPGALVTGIAVPGVAHVAAIRAPDSENAATWLHLMAATLAAVVVVPRVLLALVAAGIERYRTARLHDDLDDPYFQRLLRGFKSGAIAVDVVPYSFAVSAQSVASLELLLARALGASVTTKLAAAVAYGDEDTLADLPSGSTVVALFNAAATPEREAHGRFLANLANARRSLVVVVDEAAVNERWGGDPVRRAARRELWREFALNNAHALVFVDLANPDLDTAEAAFDAALR